MRDGRSIAATVTPLVHGWRFVLLVWAVSRAFFFGVGAAGRALIDEADFIAVYREPRGPLEYWAHWDGGWFAHIAQNGYDSVSSTAFFPLFPLVLRGLAEAGVSLPLAGVVVSTAATLAALYFVHATAAALWDERVARAAVVTMAFFPTAFYLNASYSEGLFIALSAGCLWALYVRRDLLGAGAFAYLAALARVVGVGLVLPLAYEWFRQRRRLERVSVLGVAAPLAGLAAYALFLWRGAGDPLLFRAAQEQGWGRVQSDPFSTVAGAWDEAGDGLEYVRDPASIFATSSANPPFDLANTLNFGFAILLIALLALGVRLLPIPLALYSIAVGYLTLSSPGLESPLMSLPRHVLAIVPLFFVLGRLFARAPVALALWTAASAALGAYLTLMFVSWRWVA